MGGMSRLDRCDATKATKSMKNSPYSMVSKPQRRVHVPLCGALRGGYQKIYKRLGNQILGFPLSSGFPRNPKINKFHNVMTMGSFQCRVGLMTHKYRGCIVLLSINKSVEANEEQKALTSSFDQGFTVKTSKQVFMGI
jgi:hypothetical protein